MLALLLLSAICARSLSEWCPCLHSQPRFPLNLPLLSTRGGTDVIHIARCNNNFQCFAARINHLVNRASRSFPPAVNGKDAEPFVVLTDIDGAAEYAVGQYRIKTLALTSPWGQGRTSSCRPARWAAPS